MESKRKRGRPRNKNGQWVQVNARVPKYVRLAMQAYADATHTTLSKAMAVALTMWADRHPVPVTPPKDEQP